MRLRTLLFAVLLAAAGLGLGWLLATRVPSWARPFVTDHPPVTPVAVLANQPPALAPAATSAEAARLHVLIINGGGSPAKNYQSHLTHVRQLLGVLEAAQVPPSAVTVMTGDGADPNPDLAVRQRQPESDYWMVEGTRLEPELRTPIELVNSEIPRVPLVPATRAALAIWFLTQRGQLKPGDTLLIYVTDHGSADPGDGAGSRITLWGPNQSLSTRDLGEMIDGLDPRVRVVTVMSQCYSGGFAGLFAHPDAIRNGCGYFSTTADRMAYGCYPESRGRDDVGHGFAFLRALQTDGALATAHRHTLIADTTPDVPLRTSDVFLRDLLEDAAGQKGIGSPALVDELLGQVWRDPDAFKDQTDLIDGVSDAFGIPRPSALGTLNLVTQRLQQMLAGIKQEATRKKRLQHELATANLAAFERAHPERATTVGPRTPGGAKAADEVAALGGFTRNDQSHGSGDDAVGPRLIAAHTAAVAVADLAYRTEVRLAVGLRLRLLLITLAGRMYVAGAGHEAQRRRYEQLRSCEALTLPPPSDKFAVRAPLATPLPVQFPSWEQDGALAEALLPAAMATDLPGARGTGADRAEDATADLIPYRGATPPSAGGQRHLLAFWATWCEPCRREMPVLATLARARGVPLFAIAAESPGDLQNFFAHWSQPFADNVAMNPRRTWFERHHVAGLPTVVLVAADGRIESRTEGYSPLNDYGLASAQPSAAP